MLRHRVPPFLLVSAVVVAVLTPAAADPPHVPDPYFPADGNAGYDVQHYDIDVAYAFDSGRLDGTTTVTLEALQDRSWFSLDLLLTVDEVLVDGEAVDFAKDPNRHELRVDAPLAEGEQVQVTVTYHGRPAAVWWDGESNWLANRREVVTVNEPHIAPWWFPANDHPSDKATYEVSVTTDEDKDVVGNGVREGREANGDGTATTTWVMDAPMTTYLAFFAAGDFVIRKGEAAGIPYYNAVSRLLSVRERRHALAQLRVSARITAWLQDELGPYPYTEYGGTGGFVTGIPIGFALENQTRPIYGSWIYRSVVVHELAHQWFGDAVAVEQWADIWLNEGFATYMEIRYDESRGRTTTNRWLQYNYREIPATASFWNVRIGDPGPSNLFDEAVYTRGAMTLAALRNRIGKADFRELLRTWVSSHADGNATVDEFEALAEAVSGEELDGFFDAWLHTAAKPAGTAANGL